MLPDAGAAHQSCKLQAVLRQQVKQPPWPGCPPCRVKTPSYELYGAMTTDVRVNINGEGWTVNKIQFTYFANTAAKNCLAYGPGLLPTVSSTSP